MSNTADIVLSDQTITVAPQNVQALVSFSGGGYQVIFEDGTSMPITEDNYNAIKALDYSGGGGGQGGSNMVYNTTTGKLSGAKDQNGNEVTFEVGTITITL